MIKEFRKQMGWSQQKLSEMTGIPRSTISEIERGMHRGSKREAILNRFIIGYRMNELVCETYKKMMDMRDKDMNYFCNINLYNSIDEQEDGTSLDLTSVTHSVRQVADYAYRRNIDLYTEYLKERGIFIKNDLMNNIEEKSIWQKIKDWWLK